MAEVKAKGWTLVSHFYVTKEAAVAAFHRVLLSQDTRRCSFSRHSCCARSRTKSVDQERVSGLRWHFTFNFKISSCVWEVSLSVAHKTNFFLGCDHLFDSESLSNSVADPDLLTFLWQASILKICDSVKRESFYLFIWPGSAHISSIFFTKKTAYNLVTQIR